MFSRPIYTEILLDNLKFYQKKRELIIYAWVIMSNHMHLIVKSANGDLSETLRDFKSYTSKKLVETIKEYPESRREWMFERAAKKHKRNLRYQLWKHDNHPKELESNKFPGQKLEYIHNNLESP